jgi:hypothetical protein
VREVELKRKKRDEEKYLENANVECSKHASHLIHSISNDISYTKIVFIRHASDKKSSSKIYVSPNFSKRQNNL